MIKFFIFFEKKFRNFLRQYNMTDKYLHKKIQKFRCEICDYECSKQSQLERHLSTEKHKILTNTDAKRYICECGKEYKHRQSLFNHKKKCYEIQSKSINESNELIKDLINQNKELINENKEIVKTVLNQQKTIDELVPKVGNNNSINSNNTNIIVMLNDKFKDALNLDDFIKSLTISLEDLNLTKDKGLVKGITSAFIKNLKNIDIDKRPLYCNDAKGDIVYVKDNELWERDSENKKIKDSISKVAFEQRKAIDIWTNANPEYLKDNVKQEDYIKLVKNSTQNLENTPEENKIFKNIFKEINGNNKIYL